MRKNGILGIVITRTKVEVKMEINARVKECTRKEYDGRAYFVLLVEGEGVPFGKISSASEKKVGELVRLGIGRRESDMKLVLRVL